MAWRTINITGVPTRAAMDNAVRRPVTTLDFELADGAMCSQAAEIGGYWFVTTRLTGSHPIPGPVGSERRRYTGVINNTTTPVRICYTGENLTSFEVGE